MRLRSIGRSGLRVSVVGLGTQSFGARIDLGQTRRVVDAALAAGINLVDTADGYGAAPGETEEMLGRILQGRRDDVVLATKFGGSRGNLYGGEVEALASRRYLMRAIDGSLRRLRTDYIDLYQLHRPDLTTPFEETLGALDDLVRAGKVRYAGSSYFLPWQIVEADWQAHDRRTTRFISTQQRYSLIDRRVEAELVPACLARDVGVLAFFPLATGLLTGRWRGGEPLPKGSHMEFCAKLGLATEEAGRIVDGLAAFAQERGISMVELAIGALTAQPAVSSVIAGATTPEQARANAAAGDVVLRDAELAEIDGIAPSRRQQPA
jgi:aryl-alcohol dehydrogenase-like predicted oxidoreductase